MKRNDFRKIATGTLAIVLSPFIVNAADLFLKGSSDASNPAPFSTAITTTTDWSPVTPTSSDRLLWRGLNDTVPDQQGYVSVDGSYEASGIVVSGTCGRFADMNIQFENGSELSLLSDQSQTLDFNTYDININLYAAEGATASINTNGLSVNMSSSTIGSKNLTIGKGLTINSSANMGITGSEGNIFTLNGSFSTIGTARFTDANVNIGGSFSATGAANINGSNFDITGSFSVQSINTTNACSFSVAEGGSFSATGAANIDGSNFDITGSFSVQSINDTNACSFSVAEGATLSTNENMTLSATSTLTLNGTLNVGNNLLFEKDSNTGSSPNVTIGSNAKITAQSFRTRATALILTSGSQMTLNNSTTTTTFINAGASVVEEGSTLTIITNNSNVYAATNHNSLTVNGKIIINGGKAFATSINGIVINSSGNEITTNIALGNNSDIFRGRFTVNADNDFSESALIVNSLNGGSTPSELTLGANTTLKMRGIAFYESSESLALRINLGENSVLILNDFIASGIDGCGALEDGDSISIFGFAENSIGIKNHTALDDEMLSKISVSGVDELYWKYNAQDGMYWLSTSVPEPAEWAAIFGAAALAVAILRRRRR